MSSAFPCSVRCRCRRGCPISPMPASRSSQPSRSPLRRRRSTPSPVASATPSPPCHADVRLLIAALCLLQHPRGERPDLRAGLDTLYRSEEHTSELQSRGHLVCRLLLEKKNK